MVAMAVYSVTIVLWKETTFPLCRAMERHWKRNVVSRVFSAILLLLCVCCRGHRVPHCIVVRHLSVSQDVAHCGNGDAYEQIGKRPSRRLEVSRLLWLLLLINTLLPLLHPFIGLFFQDNLGRAAANE